MTQPPILPPEAITPEWMTDVLRNAGFDATVSSLERRKIGTGQVGDSMRFTLAFAGERGDAPQTLVGKFPAANPVSRGAGVTFGNYVREIRFYQELAATAGINVPEHFLAEVNPDTHDFVLIMEDLAPAMQGDQTRGITVDQAALAIDEAAKLHASHWGDNALDGKDWLFEVEAAPKRVSAPLMQMLWAGFRDRYAGRASATHLKLGDAITSRYDQFKSGYKGPRCLVHNDYRPDNMMFGTPEGGYPVTVVDWQSLGYGCCMADVSYFLAGALSQAERKTHERELLRRYHAGLTSRGVSDYSFDQLWSDYGRFSFSLFLMGFSASMVVEQTARGDDMFFQMLDTSADHILEHNAIAILDQE